MTMFLTMTMFFVALVVIAWAPSTPLGKTLHNLLVEVPVRILSRLTPFEITASLIVFVWLIAMVLAAPELIAMIGIGDLAIYLDAAVIVMLLGTLTRLKYVLTQTVRLGQDVAARLVALSYKRRARNRSTRQHRHRRPPSSDDAEPPANWVFA